MTISLTAKSLRVTKHLRLALNKIMKQHKLQIGIETEKGGTAQSTPTHVKQY